MARQRKDLTGQRFGHLLILGFHKLAGTGHSHWRVRCDCGTEKTMLDSNIVHGKSASPSCGCMNIPGIKRAQTTHGMSQTKPFRNWGSMLNRCEKTNDKSYPAYGGRGIRVCAEWHDFAKFWADMGPSYSEGMSIERVDVNGDYAPDNCVWIPIADQHKNRRPSAQWRAVGRPSSVGMKGVTLARNGRFTAKITVTTSIGKHELRHLGTFDTKEEAAAAFQAAVARRDQR